MTTIYITDTKANLKVKSPYIFVFHHQELRQKVNINQIGQMILWYRCHLSREAASLALFRHVPVLFIGNHGEGLGGLEYSSKQQPKLLKYQRQQALNSEFTLATAETIIRAKLHNCCIVLQRLTGDRPTPIIETALNLLVLLINDLSMANSLHELREYDMMAANFYYPALASLLPCKFGFKGRKKQPSTDGINCLLNLGYTLLHQTIEVFLQELGLHPNWGNLYFNCDRQSSLVCDLMAEFCAPLVDELVIQLAIAEMLKPNDFLPDSKHGGMSLHSGTIKTFFQHWEKQLQTQIIHPHAGKVSYRQCLELQVKEYIACLLGDVESYRPMFITLNSAPVNIYPSNKSKTKQLTLVKF